jgi:hypothetical protein
MAYLPLSSLLFSVLQFALLLPKRERKKSSYVLNCTINLMSYENIFMAVVIQNHFQDMHIKANF